jgi:hypothetical protein
MNYEALGRYTAARELAERLSKERSLKLHDLKREITAVTGLGGTGHLGAQFNVAKAQELLSEIAELDGNLQSAIAEANVYAEDCGKTKLTLR